MQNSAAQGCAFFMWLIFFCNSRVAESTAHLGYRGTDHTLQIQTVKTSILQYLGMDRPPESREKISYQNMLRIFHQYSDLQMKTQPFQKDLSLFLPATVQPLNSQHSQNELVHWFRAVFQRDARITKKFILEQARLQLQIWPQHNLFTQKILIKIVQKVPTSSSSREKDIETQVLHAESHTVTLDVTAAVKKMLLQINDTLLTADIGIFTTNPGRPEPAPDPQLYLELKMKTLAGKARKSRSTSEKSLEDENHCGRKSLSVSFEEIGWSDWIVAPVGYTMFFCDGSCPHNYKPASMHAQVKSRLHRLTKGKIPRPCCVPAAYEPMILMHYDSRGKLKLTAFDDLIVSKCNCA
ncbi:protein dbl-1 [Astyanax mexicanus]|uniref:Growth/differentiation factor 9-like n=1 Tax=Astyanax mexicanus TaxID=7994 RepID=A0A8T2M5Y1_ASTMX|nr:protein dbl-1 [Astyanax mexicanus]KAG9278584.1 growth/differentiation factor 9-like [Astyanax mexicanus]